ncbi:hypothetical protein [Kitasatospora sp. NPDC059599]|uniref:hypothetical protein n=1 Tax=Kitasatospora sp. NPDC059599 TaxID=3346880 RepID=UPI0036C5309E
MTSRHPQGKVGHRTREVVSDLSRALAPAPIRDQPPGLTLLVLGAVTTAFAVFAFIAGNLARTFDHDEPGFTTLQGQGHQGFEVPAAIPVIALVVAAVFFVTGGVLNASAARELAGRPRAEHLWARAWYCDRCGTVHFPPGRGLPAGALSLQEFRRVVWHAGGYGHLVRGD